MRSFFVEPDEIRKPVATIHGSDARHIRNVLRLQPGTPVRLTDGEGRVAEARIQTIERHCVRVAVGSADTPSSADRRAMVVAQAMLKDRKMDALIRALTELGMTTWIPFKAARSVALPDERRLQTRRERWARIAREAVKQCGRRLPPQIECAAGFADILDRSAGFDQRIMFWEEARSVPVITSDGRTPSGGGRIFLIIGPEGGFSAEEAEQARRAGFQLASLGPRILRAETAALAAVTLVQYLYGDWRTGGVPDRTG
jgi:16S rRNA (uracil1498-N3)-methyltransferase